MADRRRAYEKGGAVRCMTTNAAIYSASTVRMKH